MKAYGFTLIELLVYIGITTALMTMTIDFSYQFLNSLSSIQTAVVAEETGNFILEQVLHDVNASLPISVPTTSPSVPVTNLALSTSSISFSILDHDFSLTPLIEKN